MKTALDPEPEHSINDVPNEVHRVCCDDHDHSLCGTIVEWSESAGEKEVTCVVCDDLDRAQYCPFTGICRHSSKPGE